MKKNKNKKIKICLCIVGLLALAGGSGFMIKNLIQNRNPIVEPAKNSYDVFIYTSSTGVDGTYALQPKDGNDDYYTFDSTETEITKIKDAFLLDHNTWSTLTFNSSKSTLVDKNLKLYFYSGSPVVTPTTYSYSVFIYTSSTGVDGTYALQPKDGNDDYYTFESTETEITKIKDAFLVDHSTWSSLTFNSSKSTLVDNNLKLYFYSGTAVVTPTTYSYSVFIYTSSTGVDGTYALQPKDGNDDYYTFESTETEITKIKDAFLVDHSTWSSLTYNSSKSVLNDLNASLYFY